MQIKGLRIYVVITAVVVTLAILLGIQFIYQRYNVEQPLFKLYSETKLVNDASIDDKGERVKVVLEVKKTDNLKKAYNELLEYTKQVMEGKNFELQLKDKRTGELEKAYNNSQFIIYEAIAKGDFTKMADVIESNGDKIAAQSYVFIDETNIYVEFVKKDHYLYEIIPRQAKTQNNPGAQMMGSDQV